MQATWLQPTSDLSHHHLQGDWSTFSPWLFACAISALNYPEVRKVATLQLQPGFLCLGWLQVTVWRGEVNLWYFITKHVLRWNLSRTFSPPSWARWEPSLVAVPVVVFYQVELLLWLRLTTHPSLYSWCWWQTLRWRHSCSLSLSLDSSTAA